MEILRNIWDEICKSSMDRQRAYEEAFLAKSTDLVDLERRQRLLQKQANIW